MFEEYKETIKEGICACGCGTKIPIIFRRPSGEIRFSKFLQGHNLARSIGSRAYICPICDRGYSDRKSLYRHIDKNRCLHKDKMEEFKKNWDKKCVCGCGEILRIGSVGDCLIGHTIPWNKGLTKDTDETGRLQITSERRIQEMREDSNKSGKWMSNTKIERIVKKFLKTLDVEFVHQYSFYYRYVCDFAIPSKKLIIECDGDFWHTRSMEVIEKDEEQNKFIKEKGWDIVRFWEGDILYDFENVKKKISETLM